MLTETFLDVDVENVAAGGWCVARHLFEGEERPRVIFVRHTLPGERVRVRITEETSRFLRADAVEVLKPSPDRVTPPCPYAGPSRCGGCDWQHVDLAAQRRLKAEVIREQFAKLAGIERDVLVEELPGSPDGLGWRTRVQFAVTPSGKVGLRRHRSHDVEPVDACAIADPRVEEVGVERRGWKATTAVEVITGTRDRAIIVTPRTGARATVPPLDASTAVLSRDKSGRTTKVRGTAAVRENVAGREWRVSGSGFWQVHPAAAATLVTAVTDVLAPRAGESVVDLYCGVGLFAGVLADIVGESGHVIGVESDAGAVRDARHNLRDLPYVEIERGRVETTLPRLGMEAADLVVLDPPRTGAGPEVMDAIAALRPRTVAYVSCDPATLARDVAHAAKLGLAMTDLRAFDAFPMTQHVEMLATLAPA
ncbi:MAG TPA: class I SAM-dependent RNA methyltransferase [Streptosporangiaceae bacterium]|jgi:tRNA/tmRNA/rRNA uracil-C5-methylase (TrmA/RlmC/RlmD family)